MLRERKKKTGFRGKSAGRIRGIKVLCKVIQDRKRKGFRRNAYFLG